VNETTLKQLAKAYKEACECDYVKAGDYKGLREDEMANVLVNYILKEVHDE